ncbi:MAG TPA: PhoH family protein [Gammaproteobacteria bacterium]|nr:PhoH family protein [Gammaproteobacteria bacterium]
MADKKPRLFVLDSSVLMHDPSCLFRFHEHDLYIPMTVLEELDNSKKGLSEVSRNARQTSRFMDELLKQHADYDIEQGLPLQHLALPVNGDAKHALGRLFFETHEHGVRLPPALPGNKADNTILATAMSVQQKWPDREVTLVTKDINLRIKARALKINAEDYYSDQALDDVSLLPSGLTQLPADFWDTHGKQMESWKEEGRTFYRISGPLPPTWLPGQCLHLKDESNFQAIVRKLDGNEAIIELATNYMNSKNSVWGINARNIGQNFALNFLMDPDIDFVTLLGHAGTGKTLLTLAAGLAQILDMSRYKEIIMTRVTVPVGEDIGFLPGTEEEKMTPWMGALMDNLEVLTGGEQAGGSWEREATNDLLRGKIKIRSVNFMRGRTFINRYVIIDEAQNLTAKQMKTLITRAGPGTKVVCLGNIAQIDTPYLTETTSGLTYVVDRFKHWEHSGHITLQRGERSRLADHASEVL